MFKEGDKIMLKQNCSGAIAGEIYTLTYGTTMGHNKDYLVAWKGGKMKSENGSGCMCHHNWELVKTAKKLNELNQKKNNLSTKVAI